MKFYFIIKIKKYKKLFYFLIKKKIKITLNKDIKIKYNNIIKFINKIIQYYILFYNILTYFILTYFIKYRINVIQNRSIINCYSHFTNLADPDSKDK